MATAEGSVYVLQNIKTKLYITESKGKKPRMYYGLYIGKSDKRRYGAVRWIGGDKLDAMLANHPELQAVEVKQ